MESATDKDNAAPGLMASLKRLLHTMAATVRNRVELFAVELEEDRLRLIDTLLLAAAVVVFSLLTLVMLTFSALLLASEEHRLAVAAIIAAVYLLVAVGAFWRLRMKLRNWQAFSATRAELQKDREWLEGEHSKS
jgi:uncharacterized membrane protein YqjE